MTGVPHDSLVSLCESHFSAIPAGNAVVNEKPNYTGGTVEYCRICHLRSRQLKLLHRKLVK